MGPQGLNGYKGANLVFLVGCPRSGTTYLQRLLASHARIRSGQESNLFSHHISPQIRAWETALSERGERGGIGMPCYHRKDAFMTIMEGHLAHLLQPMISGLKDGELFLEKTPMHTQSLREIARFLPESRIIHLVRDPRDVIASLLRTGRTWGKRWAPNDVHHACRKWRKHIRCVLKDGRPLSEDRFVEVRYEDLVERPGAELARIMSFLDLHWEDENMRDAIAQNTAERLRSGHGTPIPIDGEIAATTGTRIVQEPEGFVGLAKPGGWRRQLTPIEKFWVWRKTRDLMPQLGYAWRSPSPGASSNV